MSEQRESMDVETSDIFAGGGEMGALMRSLDWANTPVGPVSSWSQALRTTVGLLLRSRFPMLLWWGPRHVQFYNDAYVPIPGAKHPRAMGQAASECWAEIWHIIGPMVEAPFSGQTATWSDDLFLLVNRKGFLEETHFKVAYSPVPDETVPGTGVGGVLATVAETTEQVLGERQLKTLRELGARGAEAKTPELACQMAAATFAENGFDVPFALLYLVEPDGKGARLAGSCGFDAEDGLANRDFVDFQTRLANQTWPLLYVDLGELLGTQPLFFVRVRVANRGYDLRRSELEERSVAVVERSMRAAAGNQNAIGEGFAGGGQGKRDGAAR